jgi:menaquinone-dependent protoporphyrinogen oxidase
MNKMLVVYDTDKGSTRGVAEHIAQTLKNAGADVSLKHVSDDFSLEDYQTVIVGSPIQYDNWLISIQNFVKENSKVLKSRRLFYFFVCLSKTGTTESSREDVEKAESNILKISEDIKPVSFGKFAGVLSYKGMPFHIALVFRVLMFFKGVKEGDHRNWEEIETWAKEILK